MCKVAVVQAGSIVMNKERCIDKAIKIIEEAGEQGANLIVFPEAFIPAYPRGMSFGAVVGNRSDQGRNDFLRYAKNAITVPGPETDQLGAAVKQAGAYTVIGVIERDQETSGGTLFCTAIFFGPDGELLGKHRKLKPTGSERLIWGEGDGSTLPVFDTPFGKIGSLICWENYMPLARVAMYEKGIQIYIAPTADARDTWFATMQHIAIEGRCFVLSCNQYSTKEMYEEDLLETEEMQNMPFELTRGGSCIVNPLGKFLVEPVFGKEEILYASLDLDDITRGHFDFDVAGHYGRKDVFKLIVNEEKQ
ncbi:carbon-nitrogen hydrolase family protein [Bacillus sp. DTU_2020_1000418_1_SI_GHA_SEK_038]|uniref:carbon-nitrogen hydrolase family protein n=1 Tax=Bacillus sp. DTU_2020_1000418_1_SI_GHA_SEK_038 TaxID=3077585 RepID=UPI0028EA4FFB|nr:carbon-nitrogen hydrolase family protein [Bacillus sp. DTU_2020_1000418_1_SI_GHA_SEK_038]WNS76184.1 carbon-nitrogen hydrolase family protein [Bacillus sp. DTU_2020_1000418_1_SI_GHA_SEK_038]